MIDYDYSLIIDEGDEQRTFSPNLPKSIKNIDFITGRNSSGKSTLMNIIAAGMYGNKVSSVNPTLRGDIDSLLNSDHKKLKFDILITNPADPIQLKVTKADNEKKAVLMESTDGGVHFSALSQNEFERKYNLIYDIPDNPRTRIKEISRQLMGVYQAYEDNLQDFDSKLTKLITEVRDASNKKKAGELQEQIDKLTEKQKNNEDVIIPRATERIDTIAHIKALKEFVNSRAEVLKAQKDFDEMKKFVPNANISPVKQQRQYDNARRTVASMALTIDTEIESMCENVLKVAEKKDEPIIRQMQALKFTNPARRLALPESYSAVITAFSSLCSSYSHSCSPQDIQERNMLKQLLDVAIQYKNTTLEMPGFDSLDSFTSVLDEKFREADAKTKKSTTAQATVKDCMNLNESVKDLVKKINAIVPPSINQSEDDSIKQQRYNALKKNLEDCKSNAEKIARSAAALGINDATYMRIDSEYQHNAPELCAKTVPGLTAELEAQNKIVTSAKIENQSITGTLKYDEETLIRILSHKDHPLKDRLDDLIKMQQGINHLRQQLIKFEKNQRVIDDGHYGTLSKTDPYVVALWNYLGKVIGIIKHREQTYTVSSINTIDNIILTDTGKTIYINDMGTGQTQVTYLRSQLTKYDGRKIIALFDEVATMDRSTLNVLFDEFMSMQKKGKLLVGITVQPADADISVEEMGM